STRKRNRQPMAIPKFVCKPLCYKIAFILALFLEFNGLYAQDILVQKNGKEAAVKIIEINSQEVIYKYHNYLEGPVLIIPLDQVFLIVYENGKKEMADTLFGRKNNRISNTFIIDDNLPPGVEMKNRGIFVEGLRLIGGYDKMFQLLVASNQIEAQQQFLKGEKERKLSNQLLAAGVLFESIAVVAGVGALVYLAINSAAQVGLNNSSSDFGTSQILGISAGASCLVGTSLLIGSAVKRTESKNHYRYALDIYNTSQNKYK
ncbi:MAG: hypothetical protein K2Q22_16480, partial [Cytophagales bacterium]|nr:hypothetical protein [Cytophagales bacterium]